MGESFSTPEEFVAALDAGDIDPEEGPEPEPETRVPVAGGDGSWIEPPELPADPEPAHVKDNGRARGAKPGGRIRVTATVKRDIGAKVSMMLELPGRVWEARDPLCGGTFIRQRPEISDALVDIICDSPDLVEFFTGMGGQFMKYFKLWLACQPVLTSVWAHHVAHGGEAEVSPVQPDFHDYAA